MLEEQNTGLSQTLLSLLSDERVDQLVSGLCDRYLATQPLVQHIVSTELRPSDGYLVLAGQLLWEKWINTKEKRYKSN